MNQPEAYSFNVLIATDELSVVQNCTRILSRAGHKTDAALTPIETLHKLHEVNYDVLFLDVKLARDEGLELLERLTARPAETAVVIMLGPALVISAVETLQHGTFEFLSKPFTPFELIAAMDRALQIRESFANIGATETDELDSEFAELSGNGPTMRNLSKLISRVAPTGTSVLILGDQGTGKEIAARAIHQASTRRLEPFMKFEGKSHDAAFAPEDLFGRRSYTSEQMDSNPGMIGRVGKGTLYIDEITSLNIYLQSRLLEAIRHREYTPVNGGSPLQLSCRIILATNIDLKKAVIQDFLLPDFYTGITVFPIYLPPLSKRSEDIPALTYHYLRRFSNRYGKEIEKVGDRLLTRLIARNWLGNLRQLSSIIERMVAVCEFDTLTLENYQEVMEAGEIVIPWNEKPPSTSEELKEVKKRLRQAAVKEVERSFLTEALHRNDGNVTRAAQEVGMQRRNFQSMMRQHGIKAG